MNAHVDETSSTRPLLDLEARDHEPFSAEDIAGNLWERFDRVAARHADRPAVVDGDFTIKYGELVRGATGYAARLLETLAGTQPHAPVALLTDSPVQRIMGMWAALRLGRPFLPIDPASPSGRVQLMLRDSGAWAAVTDDPARAAFNLFEGAVIDAPGSASEPESIDAPPAAPDDPALLLYTSGSTGRPKRVVQQHRMILDSLSCYSKALRIAPDDRLSLLASAGFGEAWNDVFLALLNGAAICIREAKTHGIDGLADWLAATEITVLHCVPTLLRALTAGLPPGTRTPRLRIVNLGGEAVSRTDVRLCVERLNPDCVIVNSYGSTETKLIAQHFVDRETVLETETVPVGRARAGVEIRILNDDGEPVPPGEVGEIEVCSKSVVQGYDAGPQGDADRFVRDDAARTRYRTGDLGRFNADGLLEYLGRRDQMVKLRGYRIELSEIECLLQTHPDVQQAVVVVYEAAPQVRQLIATYQPHGGKDVSESALQTLLKERLPDYMWPSRYLRFDSFPLTETGKPDRRQLLEQVQLRFAEAADETDMADDEAEYTEVELRLKRLVGDVLQIDDVHLDAGFIELGGDSLNVTELVIRIAEEFDRQLTPQTIFEARSLRELAGAIEQPHG